MKISSGGFPTDFEIPTSKSYMARYLILAALSEEIITLRNYPQSMDTIRLIQALQLIGLKFEMDSDSIKVINSFPACENDLEEENIVVYTGDGGTTNRFLIAMLGLGKKCYQVKADPNFLLRPNEDLYAVMERLGVEVTTDQDIVAVKGPYELADVTEVEVDSSQSTQYISGLMLSHFQSDIDWKPINLKSSMTFIQLTKECIKSFKNQTEFAIPSDMSSMAFPICWGLLNEGISIPHVFRRDRHQADDKIFDLLDSLRVSYSFLENQLIIEPLKSIPHQLIEWDFADCLDLFPALTFLFAHLPSQVKMTGLENLKYKESPRLDEMMKILDLYQVAYQVEENALTLFGHTGHQQNIVYNSPQDHRITMAMAMFMKQRGGGELHGSHHADKSFPQFFEQFQAK